MPRGMLTKECTIQMVDGEIVPTFYDCDLDYLAGDEIYPGDIVSFTFVSGTRDAQNMQKVKPTPKELELQERGRSGTTAAVPTKKSATARRSAIPKRAKPAGDRLDEITAALTAAELVEPVDRQTLVQRVAGSKIDLADDDAVARMLTAYPSIASARVVAFDFHVEPEHVTAFDRALDGERVRLRVAAKTDPAKVTAVVGGKQVGVHTYDDTSSFVDWIASLLTTQAASRRLYYLPCHEGACAVVITPAQADALRAANIPIEDELPLP